MRSRTTALVTVVFLVAVVVATLAILFVLRRSLIDEVDRSNENRLTDIVVQVDEAGVITDPGFGADNDTFGAIYLQQTGEIVATSDPSADGRLLNGTFDDFDAPFDANLQHLELTDGVENLRAVATLSPGFPGEEPGVDDDGVITGDLVIYVASSLDSVDRTVGSVRTVAFIAVPLLTALVASLAWLVTGRAMRPVDRMRAEVDEITAANLNRRVEQPSGTGAIARLAATMNRMLDRVASGQARQQQFVSDASHELRSPLASLQAQLDVDLAHPDQADWPTTARSLRSETARMERTIDDLLHLARSDDGRVPIAQALVDLDDIVLSVAGEGIDTSGVSAGLVRGDADQLRRLVENLVANGRRHAESLVAVGVMESDGQVVLWVDDDGEGVDEADRARIFERFVRLDEARSRDRGGSGLGLAICAEIVTAHGGTIAVDHAPLGGARFVVRLPAT